jgi:multimeric flavodoxin WrbA
VTKILGICGSPRRRGNSALLLERTLAGAEAAGAERLPTVYVNELQFRSCQNCGGCLDTGVCIEKDGMTAVYPLLRAAAIWVLASPIYFDNITGSMKSFFDRLYCLDKPAGAKLPGRRAGGFIFVYEDKLRQDYRGYIEVYRRYLSWFGDFVFTDVLEGHRLARAGDVLNRAELLGQAEKLGTELVNRLSSTPPGESQPGDRRPPVS